MRDWYRPGDHYVICDRCGFKKHASQASRDWNGLVVCFEDLDGRHPQDYVRGKKDVMAAHDPVRPENTDTFLAVGDVTADDL